METKEKKSFGNYMRVLHRDIGFFLLGFILIYAFSGIILIYRDSDFLKHDKIVKVTLPAGTDPSELGPLLRLRDFKILETAGGIIHFQGGSFNTSTGEAEYTVREVIFPFNKYTALHKTASKNPLHWFTLTFGVLLLFLAVSSLWMVSTKSRLFKRMVVLIPAGLIFAALILLFIK